MTITKAKLCVAILFGLFAAALVLGGCSLLDKQKSKSSEQANETETERVYVEPTPYELTSENIKYAEPGDRVYVTGDISLYTASGYVGIITTSGGKLDRQSLRVKIPKTENGSGMPYEIDCDVCNPDQYADVFYEHAAVDFHSNGYGTVSGTICSINKGEETGALFGVNLEDALVEDLWFN